MPLLNQFLRWSGYALLAGFLGGCGILAWMYLWVLPHIQDYKGTLENLLSSSTGLQVRLQSIDGEWGGARPRFTLHGVTMLDAANKPVLQFSRIDGQFGWRSVFTLEPRFHLLSVSGTSLTLLRTQDGKFHLGGITFNPGSQNHDFSDWLLKQGEVAMHDVTLIWNDELRQAPPLIINSIDVDLKNLGRRHKLELQAVPPAELSGPVDIKGLLYGRHAALRREWSGTLTGTFRNLDLSAFAPWVSLDASLTGRGGLTFAAKLDKGQLVAANAQVNMVNVGASMSQCAARCHFRKLIGGIGWKLQGSSQYVSFDSVSLLTEGGRSVGPINAQFGWNAQGYKVSADELDLQAVDVLLPWMPLSQPLRDQLIALNPAGRVDHFSASWNKSSGPGTIVPFIVNARFHQLAWNAVGKLPGVRGLTGNLNGDQDKGEFSLEMAPGQLDLPALFRDATINWTRLSLAGGWLHKSGGYELRLADANMENADLKGSVAGTYLIGNTVPDRVDLSGRLERASAQAVYKYIPAVVSVHTYDWLQKSLQGGVARQVSFVLRGPMRLFPFPKDVGGLFHIDAQVNGATLNYGVGWPRIDDIDGELRFRDDQIEIFSDHAQIYSAKLHMVQAVISNFTSQEPVLDIKGNATGPFGEFVRFANFSPVAERIGNLTDEMSGNGMVDLALNLKVPIKHSEDTTVAGRLIFKNDMVFPAADIPRIEQVSGMLDFTGSSVSASRIDARILGGPAVITVSHRDSGTLVAAHGTLSAGSLAPWMGKKLGGLLKGGTGWKGELVLGERQTNLKVESSLIGLQSNLPAPLTKPSGQAVALSIDRHSSQKGLVVTTAKYGSIVNAVWETHSGAAGAVLDHGEIRFGGNAQLPQRPGLSVAGTVQDFELGRWLDLMPDDGSNQSSYLNDIDLTLSSMEFLGRRFSDINLNGRLRGGILKVEVNGQGIHGSVAYRKGSSSEASRLSGIFRQLVVPAAQAGSAGQSRQRINAPGFPTLDVSVDDLRMGEILLGHLEAVAHASSDGLIIDQLRLEAPDSTASMSGLWRDGGIGETRVNMNVEIRDEGKLLARFGFPNTVRRGKGTITGEVAWQGSPADFSLRTLDGTLEIKSEQGQFLKVDPGVGKLLGIISLQSIPRRLTLDFRDIFSSGFAFDDISATLRVAAGNVYSDNFRMKGPSATVKMSGVAKLADETVQLRVEVSPKLSEGVAVAGALLGGPVAGLGALAVQKLLKDPIETATSSEYLINGSWTDPVVTKLQPENKTRDKQDERIP